MVERDRMFHYLCNSNCISNNYLLVMKKIRVSVLRFETLHATECGLCRLYWCRNVHSTVVYAKLTNRL